MRLSGFTLPIERISASSLSKAVQCPEQWRRRYLGKQYEGFGVDRFVGSVDHKTIGANFEKKIETGKDMSAEEIQVVFQYVWKQELENEEYHASKRGEDLNWQERDPQQCWDKSLGMILLYHEKVAPLVEPIAVEKGFEEKIAGVPVPIVGYLDLESPQSIIERKTAATKLSKPKSAWRMQGRIYHLVTDKPVEWQITTKQATPQIVLGRNEPGLMMHRTNPDVTVSMIQNTIYQLNDLYQRLGPDNPWPTTGIYHDWLCDYCQFGPRYANSCVAWKGNQ